LGLSSEQPMHFCEGKAKLFLLSEKYVYARLVVCRGKRHNQEVMCRDDFTLKIPSDTESKSFGGICACETVYQATITR
jgi:hypothetical protein